jgi:hypothetical protein
LPEIRPPPLGLQLQIPEGRFPTFKQTNVGPVLDHLRTMMSRVKAPALATPTLPSASILKGITFKVGGPALRYIHRVKSLPSMGNAIGPQVQRSITKALKASLANAAGGARTTAKVGAGVGAGALALHMGSTVVQHALTGPSVLAALGSVAHAMIASAGNAGGFAAATAALAGQLAGGAGVAASTSFVQAGAAAIMSETTAITLLTTLVQMAPAMIPILVVAMVAQIPVQKQRADAPSYQRLEYDEDYDPFKPAKPRLPKPVPLPPKPPAPPPPPKPPALPAPAAPSVVSQLTSLVGKLVQPVAIQVRKITMPAFQPGRGTKRKLTEASLREYTDELKRIRISTEKELERVAERTLVHLRLRMRAQKQRPSVRERATTRREAMRTKATAARRATKRQSTRQTVFDQQQERRRQMHQEAQRVLERQVASRMARKKRRSTEETAWAREGAALEEHKRETRRRAAADQVIIERNMKRLRVSEAAYDRSFPLRAPPEAGPTKLRVPGQRAGGKTRRPTRKQLLRASRRLKL